MKLYSSPRSPYARKVLAIAFEKGLFDKIEPMPKTAVAEFEKVNPLSKVPTLITDDGDALIESALISQYLDEIGHGRRLYPESGWPRTQMLQLEAIGHGVCDAGVLLRMEERTHKPEQISPEWVERQRRKVVCGLGVVERAILELAREITPAHITFACSLFFLEKYDLAHGWRASHPELASWYDAFNEEECMQVTHPSRMGD